MANNNNKMKVEEEEVDLRRRLHLFSLVLKNMDMDNVESGASTAQQQQQQQNRYHLLAKLERTLEDVSEGVKRSSWYAELRLEWAARISQYRSSQKADDAADDELESFFNRGFNKRSEVEMMATTWNYNHHHNNNNNQEQSAELIDKASELQPTTLERVTQWLSSLPPSSLNTFVASASASFSSPLLSLEGNNGINSCPSTLADQNNNNQHIQQQQHYFHHHLFYNNCSPVVGTMQSGPVFAPTIQTPLTIRIPTQIQIPCPFLLPNTVSSKNGLLPVPRPQQQQQQQQQRKFPVVAPHHLRLQVFYELSHLPSVTLPIQLSILNRLFIDVACIARWIFPYLDDRHFQTAIFEAAFAKLPATLQAKFRAQCSATPRGQGQAGKLKAKQIVNLIAFLRICVRGQIVLTRAAMSRQAVKKENWRKLQKSPPPRFCAFCKLYTTHDIVGCPLRVFDICHRCFQHGHTFRHCVNPPLLPLAWLNSGLISYEQKVFEQ